MTRIDYKTAKNIITFFRAMLCKRGLSRHTASVCPSVCPSVTVVDSVETNEQIFGIFSPSGSHTTLVFTYQTSWQYSDGDRLTGASNARGCENPD